MSDDQPLDDLIRQPYNTDAPKRPRDEEGDEENEDDFAERMSWPASKAAQAALRKKVEESIKNAASARIAELGPRVIQEDAQSLLEVFLKGALADGELKSDFNVQAEALDAIRQRVAAEQANANAEAASSSASVGAVFENVAEMQSTELGSSIMETIALEMADMLAASTPSQIPISVSTTENNPPAASVASTLFTLDEQPPRLDPFRVQAAAEMLDSMVAAVRRAKEIEDEQKKLALANVLESLGSSAQQAAKASVSDKWKNTKGVSEYDKNLLKLVQERLKFLNENPRLRRIQATGNADRSIDDPCAPTAGLFILKETKQWGPNAEPRMPDEAEIKLEFPGTSNARWRKWINEVVRAAHPGKSKRKADNKLTEVMRDDLKYGQCDAPEYRSGSGSFVRHSVHKGGGIVFQNDAHGNNVPKRHPKTNVVYAGGKTTHVDDGSVRYRKVVVNGMPVLSNIDGTPLAIPVPAFKEARRAQMSAIASNFQTGTMDGNGGPTLVDRRQRRSTRDFRHGYAIIIPIRMNNYHWEAQYGRGLVNPLPEASCVAPVAPKNGYSTTIKEYEGKLATVPESKFDRPKFDGIPATSDFAMPVLPCRSYADAGLRDALAVMTAKVVSKEDNRVIHEAAKTPADAAAIVEASKAEAKAAIPAEDIERARSQALADALSKGAEAEEAEEEANKAADAVRLAAGASFLDYMPTESRVQEVYVAVNGSSAVSTAGEAPAGFVSLVEASKLQTTSSVGVTWAEKLRRTMFFPARPQHYSEHPPRSGGSILGRQPVEFDARKSPSQIGDALPEPPIFTGYKPDKKGKGKSARHPTIKLYPTAFTTDRWLPNPDIPRRAAAVAGGAGRAAKAALEGVPITEVSQKKNRMLGHELQPAFVAPFTLGQVVERFLADQYDGFQYQTTSEHGFIENKRANFSMPSRMHEGNESVLPGSTPSGLLIARPLPQHNGRGGLYASIRLDIGGDAGNGGLDSFLPADPDWGLHRLAAKGVRAIEEIWDSADPAITGDRAGRNGPPHWFLRETKTMRENPTSPWLAADAGERRPVEGFAPTSHVPTEFIPPERLGISHHITRYLLRAMTTNRLERLKVPEMGGNREVDDNDDDEKLMQAMQDIFDEDDEEEFNYETAEEHYASTEDQGDVAARARAEEDAAKTDPSDEEFDEDDLFGSDEPMDMGAFLSVANPAEAGLRTRKKVQVTTGAKGSSHAPDDREGSDSRGKILVFPLYVTLFDADDFEQARYKIDHEWQAFGEEHPHYLVEADRFYLDPATNELVEGRSTYLDRVTGLIKTTEYVPPHVTNRKPGTPAMRDGSFYVTTPNCTRPAERLRESWLRDRLEFGRAQDPRRKVWRGDASVGPVDEDGSSWVGDTEPPKAAFERRVIAWEQAWERRKHYMMTSTRLVQNEMDAQEYLTSAQIRARRLSWYSSLQKALDAEDKKSPLTQASPVGALLYVHDLLHDFAGFVQHAHLLDKLVVSTRRDYDSADEATIARLAEDHPRIHSLLGLEAADWSTPTREQAVVGILPLASQVFAAIKAVRDDEREDLQLAIVAALAGITYEGSAPLSNVTVDTCMTSHLEISRVVIEVALRHMLDAIADIAGWAHAPSIGKDDRHVRDAFIVRTDIDAIESLLKAASAVEGSAFTPLDALRRESLVATTLAIEPPLHAHISFAILPSWPVGVPRSLSERDINGVTFMSVFPLLNHNSDQVELVRNLLTTSGNTSSTSLAAIIAKASTASVIDLFRKTAGMTTEDATRAVDDLISVSKHEKVGLLASVTRTFQRARQQQAAANIMATNVDVAKGATTPFPPGTTLEQIQAIEANLTSESEKTLKLAQNLEALAVTLRRVYDELKKKPLVFTFEDGRNVAYEFTKRVKEPAMGRYWPLSTPEAKQAWTGYTPLFLKGDDYVRTSDADVANRIGNGLDTQKESDNAKFNGSEIYGPKGAYKRHVLEIIAATRQADADDTTPPPLPLSYRDWYDSQENKPLEYIGTNRFTGQIHWPKERVEKPLHGERLTKEQKQLLAAMDASNEKPEMPADSPSASMDVQFKMPSLELWSEIPMRNLERSAQMVDEVEAINSIGAREHYVSMRDDQLLPARPEVVEWLDFLSDTSVWFSEPDIAEKIYPTHDADVRANNYNDYRMLEALELEHACTTTGLQSTEGQTRFQREYSAFHLPYYYALAADSVEALDTRPAFEPPPTPIHLPTAPVRDAQRPSDDTEEDPEDWEDGLFD